MSENSFRQAIKTLVQEEPGKLAFFNGLDESGAIPPFIPAETAQGMTASGGPGQNDSGERTRVTAFKRRRRYNFAMATAAACFVVCLCVTAVNYQPGMFVSESPKVAEEYSGTAGSAAQPPDDADGIEFRPNLSSGTDDPQQDDPQQDDGVSISIPADDVDGEAVTTFVNTQKASGLIPFALALAGMVVCAILFIRFLIKRNQRPQSRY